MLPSLSESIIRVGMSGVLITLVGSPSCIIIFVVFVRFELFLLVNAAIAADSLLDVVLQISVLQVFL